MFINKNNHPYNDNRITTIDCEENKFINLNDYFFISFHFLISYHHVTIVERKTHLKDNLMIESIKSMIRE